MATEAKVARVAIDNILLATDFSTESVNALQYALALAKRFESELFITCAMPSDRDARSAEPQLPLQDMMQRDAERSMVLLEQSDQVQAFPHEMILRKGHPSKSMLNLRRRLRSSGDCNPGKEIVCLANSRDAELIVTGSHGGGARATHLPWSTLHYVVQNACCPVLTVCGA